MTAVVYYSQEDKRWAGRPYTIRNDPAQTIGTSGCGPTCMAMVASTLLGREILPPELCQFAVKNGYRTANSGTAWGFFGAAAKQYGLEMYQTAVFETAKQALEQGALVIASMGPGHFTGGGHYILLVAVEKGRIKVFDPNHDNTKYGADGLIDQGARNDGVVWAKDDVFRREARQFWIFPWEVEKPMTQEEKAAFEALRKDVAALREGIAALSAQVGALLAAHSMDVPAWAKPAVDAAIAAGVVDTPHGGSLDFYRILTVMHRKGLF